MVAGESALFESEQLCGSNVSGLKKWASPWLAYLPFPPPGVARGYFIGRLITAMGGRGRGKGKGNVYAKGRADAEVTWRKVDSKDPLPNTPDKTNPSHAPTPPGAETVQQVQQGGAVASPQSFMANRRAELMLLPTLKASPNDPRPP